LAHQPEEDAADLSRELGLQLRDKTPKRWVQSEAARGPPQCHAAERDLGHGTSWHDQLATGTKLRAEIVDTFSHHPPELDHQRHANLGWGFSG